jgi:hypothetical protein
MLEQQKVTPKLAPANQKPISTHPRQSDLIIQLKTTDFDIPSFISKPTPHHMIQITNISVRSEYLLPIEQELMHKQHFCTEFLFIFQIDFSRPYNRTFKSGGASMRSGNPYNIITPKHIR